MYQLFCALHYKALKRRDMSGAVGSSEDGSKNADDGADLGKIVNLMQLVVSAFDCVYYRANC